MKKHTVKNYGDLTRCLLSYLIKIQNNRIVDAIKINLEINRRRDKKKTMEKYFEVFVKICLYYYGD